MFSSCQPIPQGPFPLGSFPAIPPQACSVAWGCYVTLIYIQATRPFYSIHAFLFTYWKQSKKLGTIIKK